VKETEKIKHHSLLSADSSDELIKEPFEVTSSKLNLHTLGRPGFVARSILLLVVPTSPLLGDALGFAARNESNGVSGALSRSTGGR
jgi:hypothetical protein